MTDELQEPITENEPKAEKPAWEPNISPTPGTSDKNLWVVLGIATGLACICSFLCIALIATGVGKILVEQAPVELILDTFMKDMEAKDVESAYTLFSPRSQRQTPITEVEKLIEGNNYAIFEGYQSLTVQNLNLTAAANTNPDMPQGTVANVTGTVSYEGGFTGTFNAVLEKVDGQWKLFNINITVPPDKFAP
jgi:hypothetical protein